MDDAGVGRNDAEVLECVLAPAQERVAFAVAREFEPGVEVGRVGFGVVIDLNGVIDDELDRLQRIDLARIAAEAEDPVAHRREIDDGRNTGEVLKQHARGGERNLLLNLRGHVPAGQRLNVFGIDEARVLPAQQVLEQDFQRERQAPERRKTRLFERRQAEHVKGLPAGAQRGSCAERIVGTHPLIILHSAVSVQGPTRARNHRRSARKARTTSAGSRRSVSTARFIPRMSESDTRPPSAANVSRTAGCASRVVVRETATAS